MGESRTNFFKVFSHKQQVERVKTKQLGMTISYIRVFVREGKGPRKEGKREGARW